MKLHLLKSDVDEFVTFLLDHRPDEYLYKYVMLDQIRSRWDLTTNDLSGMYASSLQSEVTTRWWNRPAYNPKEVMLAFIEMEPDYVRQAFRDLFDESKRVDRRIDRFQFYCGELLRMYKSRNRTSIVNHHYQDAMMLSVYLSAMEPTRYTLYPGEEAFNKFLTRVGASRDEVTLPRYIKVVRIVMKYLTEHPRFSELKPLNSQQNDNLLLAHASILHAIGSWNHQTP